MTSYQFLSKYVTKYIAPSTLFKYGFNYAPMYRRTTAKVVDVSKDLLHVKVVIPLTYQTQNYVGSMFGGTMLAATDPILMVQLINILNNFSNNPDIAQAIDGGGTDDDDESFIEGKERCFETATTTTDYVVWDKGVQMKFIRPAFEDVQVEFDWTTQELQQIKKDVMTNGEIEFDKDIQLTNVVIVPSNNTNDSDDDPTREKDKEKIFAVSAKTLYIATKEHYEQKLIDRKKNEEKENR